VAITYLHISQFLTLEREIDMADKVVRTDDEWRAQLSDMAYKVTRKGKTERAFTNDNFPKTAGKFSCVCCGTALFDTDAKFDSGTGWPSFYQAAVADAVGEKADNSLFMRRTEVICNACDAHLGHVFPDGPQPTGQRFCINGAALDFEAAKSED